MQAKAVYRKGDRAEMAYRNGLQEESGISEGAQPGALTKQYQ